MKLTRASNYALQAIGYMAAQPTQKAIASHTIARQRGIPERFLLKVLKPLVDSGVLVSIKGPSGGYRLAKDLTDITILEVLEAVDGDIIGRIPSREPTEKPDLLLANKLENVCKEVAEQVRDNLASVKLSDLTLR